MPKPTPIYKATCQECQEVTYHFFIPMEGQTEIYPLPCDSCNGLYKLELANPEDAPKFLADWHWESKLVTE